jgi:hypothetical protein
VGGYTTGTQSEEEEEEAGAGQGTRGGVHYGQTLRGGGEGGRCRASTEAADTPRIIPVWGSGLAQGLRFRVSGLRLGVRGLGFRV